ncbi:unnamed protein product [Owenia fusiformis]|uniref:LEM domain-containing protein n=1 Tax=Owenia fusiformis TaxID=6347 RepID=A0A8S4PWB5_OWEFU|nr:unnamed protein product [Owenia fusiformis]
MLLEHELIEALQGEDISTVEGCLYMGANPNLVLPDGAAAMHISVGVDSDQAEDFVKLMIQYGGNPNVQDTEGVTPLHAAASWGRAEILKLLLVNGGDPTLKDQDGMDVEAYALESKDDLTIKYVELFAFNEKGDDSSEGEDKPVEHYTLELLDAGDKNSRYSWGTSSCRSSWGRHMAPSPPLEPGTSPPPYNSNTCTIHPHPSHPHINPAHMHSEDVANGDICDEIYKLYIDSADKTEEEDNKLHKNDFLEPVNRITKNQQDNYIKPSRLSNVFEPNSHNNPKRSKRSQRTRLSIPVKQRQSFYTSKVQAVLNDDYDQGSQIFDVTSPDHPIVVERQSLDDTMEKIERRRSKYPIISSKDGYFRFQVDSEISFASIAHRDQDDRDMACQQEHVGSPFKSYRTRSKSASLSSGNESFESCSSGGSYHSTHNNSLELPSAKDTSSHVKDKDNASAGSLSSKSDIFYDTVEPNSIKPVYLKPLPMCHEPHSPSDKVPNTAKRSNDKVPSASKSTNDKLPSTAQSINNKVSCSSKSTNDNLPRIAQSNNDKVSSTSKSPSNKVPSMAQSTYDKVPSTSKSTHDKVPSTAQYYRSIKDGQIKKEERTDTDSLNDSLLSHLTQLKLGDTPKSSKPQVTKYKPNKPSVDLFTSDESDLDTTLNILSKRNRYSIRTLRKPNGYTPSEPMEHCNCTCPPEDGDSEYSSTSSLSDRLSSSGMSGRNSVGSNQSCRSELSNYSEGASIMHLYRDDQEDCSLIEHHYLPDSSLYSHHSPDVSLSLTTLGISSALEPLSNEEIRAQLVAMGDQPGPVVNSLRDVYLKRLARLKNDPDLPKIIVKSTESEYLPELTKALEGDLYPSDVSVMEQHMEAPFKDSDPSLKWREGTLKTSFNYILLDPRFTQNLPSRAKYMSEQDVFRIFISAIFYIGKGKRSRPYQHFYEAIKQRDSPKPKCSAKVQRILDIWSEGYGPVSLHIFQNTIPVEAYTREACMVESIGLSRLTNQKSGDYYGISSTWKPLDKRKLGVHLLVRAMRVLLAEGERQITPRDIKIGQ